MPCGAVCFIIERIANRSGGAERIVIELGNWLASQGIPVRIVSYERSKGKPFYPLAFGVTHCNLRRPDNTRGWIRRGLDRMRSTIHGAPLFIEPFGKLFWHSKHGGFERALERDLFIHRPEVAVSFLPPAIVALGRVKVPPGLRRIASVHNVPELDLASTARWDPNPLDVRRRMEALIAHDEITVLLDEFRNWFPSDLRVKVRVIPNLVSPASEVKIHCEKLVVSVGRLAEVKRHEVLVDAWAQVIDSFPDWRLQIYGVGPMYQSLTARIAAMGLQASISLEGHVHGIDSVYKRAAILAHPAAYEGWGLAVTEALAHGVPAIGFEDCPGVNQLIRHEENGLLASSQGKREETLATALSRLMSDEPLRRRLAARGPASVAAFAPDRVHSQWLKALYPKQETSQKVTLCNKAIPEDGIYISPYDVKGVKI
jgi:glycosyltransferase involved in cell wall biosynthesis